MTWKSGDSVSLPVYFETLPGVATVYANSGAFTTAGGSVVWYSGSTALASQPTFTLTPIGTGGWHTMAFALPAGVTHALINSPTGITSSPTDMVLVTMGNDLDSLAATIAAVTGSAIPGGAVQAYDFSSIEGDCFVPQVFTIPSSALSFLNTSTKLVETYADLSDIGGQPWTIAASARGGWNQAPAGAVTFSYDAVVTSKTLRTVAISFSTPPGGAVVVNADGSADSTGSQSSTTFKYDIQLMPPTGSTYAGRKITVVTGNHTILRQQTTTP